jgi:hypothetical protein
MKGNGVYKTPVKRCLARNVLIKIVISNRLFFHGRIIYNILELDGWIATICSGQKTKPTHGRLVGKEVTFQPHAPNKKKGYP